MNRGMMALGALVFAVGLTYAAWFASYLPQPPPQHEGEWVQPEGLERISLWADQVGARFAGGLVFMIVGGLVARRAKKAGAKDEEEEKGGKKKDPPTMLANFEELLERLAEASRGFADGPAEAVKVAEELDGFLNDDVPAFLEQRTQMIDAIGLERFAEMIGYFASMERGAARAWSAITDEALEEAKPSLARALRSVKSARAAYGGET